MKALWFSIGNNEKPNKPLSHLANKDEETSNLYLEDTCNLGYTEEEFIKEFQDEDQDEQRNYENDPR